MATTPSGCDGHQVGHQLEESTRTTQPGLPRPVLLRVVRGRFGKFLTAFFGPLGGAFVLDVADCQPEQFHNRGVVGGGSRMATTAASAMIICGRS